MPPPIGTRTVIGQVNAPRVRVRQRAAWLVSWSYAGPMNPSNWISGTGCMPAIARPIDVETISQSVSKTGRCVIVHEAPKTAGMGAEISALIQEHCFLYLEAPVQRVTGFDTPVPYYKLELDYLPDANRITQSIRDCLSY